MVTAVHRAAVEYGGWFVHSVCWVDAFHYRPFLSPFDKLYPYLFYVLASTGSRIPCLLVIPQGERKAQAYNPFVVPDVSMTSLYVDVSSSLV